MLNESAKKRLIELISIEKQFREEGLPMHSGTIGEYLGRSGDTIRKDLSLLNKSSPEGDVANRKHYENRRIGNEVKEILKLPGSIKVCLVGLNTMGVYMMKCIQNWEDVELSAIFDTDINRMERMDLPVRAFPAWEIPEITASLGITTAVLTTNADDAEKNADRLLKGGIKSILNLTGFYLNRSEGTKIRNLNLFTELLTLEI